MRDRAVPVPGEDRRLRLGSNSGHRHYRQTTKANQRRMCQLRNQVGLDVNKIIFRVILC